MPVIVECGPYTCSAFHQELQQRPGEIAFYGFPHFDAAVHAVLL